MQPQAQNATMNRRDRRGFAGLVDHCLLTKQAVRFGIRHQLDDAACIEVDERSLNIVEGERISVLMPCTWAVCSLRERIDLPGFHKLALIL